MSQNRNLVRSQYGLTAAPSSGLFRTCQLPTRTEYIHCRGQLQTPRCAVVVKIAQCPQFGTLYLYRCLSSCNARGHNIAALVGVLGGISWFLEDSYCVGFISVAGFASWSTKLWSDAVLKSATLSSAHLVEPVLSHASPMQL